MYEPFFGLKESPFNLTPDPRFVYFSRQHREALSALVYGIQTRRGFIQITGGIGTGKTTICRALLGQLGEKVHTALVFNPKLSEFEILQSIVEDFGIEPKKRRKKDYFDALNRFLLTEIEKDFNAVAIIDEAQLVSPKALEQIRLISNLETATQKLIQIVLVGQPEFRETLRRPDLEQLYQRITIRYHLGPLSRQEMEEYIIHRMSVAGGEGSFFTTEAFEKIFDYSKGVPRLVNVVTDRALMAAFSETKRMVDWDSVDYAREDLQGAKA